MKPPQNFELMLEGLSSQPASLETLLGDLTEEWNERVVRTGLTSANAWYRSQALRAVPPLLGQWLRQTGWLSILSNLFVGFLVRALAWVAGAAFVLYTGTILKSLFGAEPWLDAGLNLFGNAASAFLCGVLFAYVYRNAPLARALCLALPFLWLPVVAVDMTSNEQLLAVSPTVERLLGAVAALYGVFDTLRYRKSTDAIGVA